MTGSLSTPSFSMARSRITPVVVSSMLATTLATSSLRSARSSLAAHLRTSVWTSSSRSSAMKIMALTRSAPSSIVTWGCVLQGGGDVPVIAVLVLALDRVDRDAVILDQAGRDVVLGRQRVGCAQQQIGASGLERLGQVGGLGRDVQAGRHPHSGQRLFLLEPLANRPQDGHVALGPLDSLSPGFSQRQVFHVPFAGGMQPRLPMQVLLK